MTAPWPQQTLSTLITYCRDGKEPREIARLLGPKYLPNHVVSRIGVLRKAGIDLGPRYDNPHRAAMPQLADDGLKAKIGDLKFKRAMLRAKHAKTENVYIGVTTAPGTDGRSQVVRPVTFVPQQSSISNF